MISITTETCVAGLAGSQVFDFLLNATEQEYQNWWPGVHIRLSTLRRSPNRIGNLVYMEEFIGEDRVKAYAIIIEAVPGKRIVWQAKWGVRLPGRLMLDLKDDDSGVLITHTIEAGFNGFGRFLDFAFRLYLTKKFAAAMHEHVCTEFPRLRDFLSKTSSVLPSTPLRFNRPADC